MSREIKALGTDYDGTIARQAEFLGRILSGTLPPSRQTRDLFPQNTVYGVGDGVEYRDLKNHLSLTLSPKGPKAERERAS